MGVPKTFFFSFWECNRYMFKSSTIVFRHLALKFHDDNERIWGILIADEFPHVQSQVTTESVTSQ